MRKNAASFGRLRPLVVLSAIVLGMASIATADEQPGSDVDLATAIGQLQKWRSSFASIHVEWRSWYRSAYAQRFPEMDLDKELGVNYFTKYEFWWADWGAFRRDMTHVEAGRTVHHDTMADTTKPLSAIVTMNGIYGLWNSSGKWLPDRLLGGDLKVTLDELDGNRCIVVRLTSELRQETIWLDREFDGLPRKVEVLGRSPEETSLRHFHSWLVSEFQRVDDRIWFPKRGNYIVGDEGLPGFEWIIDRVVLNESLPRSLFEASQPARNAKASGYLGEKAYGSSAAKAISALTSIPSTTTAAGDVVATPHSLAWRWVMAAIASLLALGIAVRWFQRFRGNSGFGLLLSPRAPAHPTDSTDR